MLLAANASPIPSTLAMAMRPPPLHAVIEAARLAALHSYPALEGLHAPKYSLLAERAARCMDVQAGLIAMIDQHTLRVIGEYGAAFERVPRLGTFCDQAVTAVDDTLLVRDAVEEKRFQGLPWVIGPPYLRFYAGAVLQDEDGYRLGTICALDQAPGDASGAAMQGLRALAGEVTAELARDRDAATGRVSLPVPPSAVQGWLGVRTDTGRGGRPGLIVVRVAQDSPARRAGVRPADVLLAIDNHALWTTADVANALSGRAPGSVARLRLLRLGYELECAVAVEPDRRRV